MKKRDTEKDFITAFWKLYADRPIEKISVGQLCETAGYNRSTFYNHFGDIRHLFEKAVSTIFEPVKERIMSGQGFRHILYGNMMGPLLMSAFTQKDGYIELLFKRQDHRLLERKMKEEMTAFIRDDCSENTDIISIDILLEYQLSAVIGVISYWYRNDKPIPKEEMLKKLYLISSKGMLTCLKEQLRRNDL